MNRFPIALAAAALLCSTAATAQTKPAAKPTPAKVAAAKPAPAPAKPAAKPAPRAKPAAATGARLVSAKLSNGKTVTYNCALAGNKTKKACQ